MGNIAKFEDARTVARAITCEGGEYAYIRNPSHVFPRGEYSPLAAKIGGPVPKLEAVVMDMDGTTTTTENLCLHALETTVRRMTGLTDPSLWPGLDRERDYPHVIGNSTTRHVEYLIEAYGRRLDRKSFERHFLEAAWRTARTGNDPRRVLEARSALKAAGCARLLNGSDKADDACSRIDDAIQNVHLTDHSLQVRAALEIYYSCYHEILSALTGETSESLTQKLGPGRRLIEPMPGVAVTLALIKGWLGAEADRFYDILRADIRDETELPPAVESRARLRALGKRFAAGPLRVGLVTSSIRYEADIVLGEVFAAIRRQIRDWPAHRDLTDQFAEPTRYYDAVVTASDSSEMRLKPHRDLYSIALHELHVPPTRFGAVAGFEDSEAGLVAMRASGIGLAVAVPFAETEGHDASAAAHVLASGLPQAILQHNLFLATAPAPKLREKT